MGSTAAVVRALLLLVVAGCASAAPVASQPGAGSAPTGAAASTRSPDVGPQGASPARSVLPAPDEPTWTLPPVPSLPPLPAAPSDALPRAAIADKDGVRLRIELDRNPLVAGKPTWITTEVRNTGSDDVIWLSDGCETAVGVSGRVVGVLWRLGRPQVGAAATFKKDLRFGIGGISIGFTPEGFVGKHGFGCADVGVEHRIAPGATIRSRALWDGGASQHLGLPPTAPVDVTARFRFYERESRLRHVDQPRRAISLSLASWIVRGRDRALPDPPEIVDAALADGAFREWLASKDVGNGSSAFARLDGETGRWNVGLFEYDVVEPGRLHYVELDARAAAVVGRVERPWDQDADGFP